MEKQRLIVIGGGAAGFFCAINAAAQNTELDVIIMEKTTKILSKVRVSGGGRCNVTHSCYSIPAMMKNYPRGANFLKKAFYQFFTTDTVKWFEERGVNLKIEKDGRMFPVTDSSLTIIDCLLAEANKSGVQLRLNQEVREIRNNEGKWLIKSKADKEKEEETAADYVCVACGGYPKSSMFNWLKLLGHTIAEPLPSLFTFNIPDNPVTRLMGVSVENVRVKIKGTKLQEEAPLLITHWGMSGPSILRLSAWGARYLAGETGKNALLPLKNSTESLLENSTESPGENTVESLLENSTESPLENSVKSLLENSAGGGEKHTAQRYHFEIIVNWIPSFNENTLRIYFQNLRRELATQKIINRNPFRLPQRLWEFLLLSSGIDPEIRWSVLPAKQQNLLIRNLCSQEFSVKGKTTFKEEFVTAGGINLEEVDPATMMSKIHNNLFFAGEILDVDGVTGGFNFQHAWTSAWIAAKSIGSQMISQEL